MLLRPVISSQATSPCGSAIAQDLEGLGDDVLAARGPVFRGKEVEQLVVQLVGAALNEGAHEALAALEVMMNSGMEDTDVGGDVLETNAFRPFARQAPLRGIENETTRVLGRAADALVGDLGKCWSSRLSGVCRASPVSALRDFVIFVSFGARGASTNY